MIIYKVTNKINGKIYIGQTIQPLNIRWSSHCSEYSGCTAIKRAIKKYGVENFTIEQIDVATTQEELDQKEQHYIEYYKSLVPNGYNLTTGGEHPHLTDEVRKKLSERQMGDKNYWFGKKFTEEHRRKISESNKGKRLGIKLSDETKRKLSETHKGRPSNNVISEQCRRAAIASRKGKPLSLETRKKLSEIFKGREFSDETRKKLSVANTGKHHSEETKCKLRELNIGSKSPKAKRVICIETGEIFGCVEDALRRCNIQGGISEVCKGKQKTAAGFHWRYAS